MKENKQQLYEGMYILSASLSEEARKKALERIGSEIEARGGQIKKVFELGRRKLAYPISGKRDGFYYVLYFAVNTSEISKMWKEYHLNEDLLRFMTLVAESVPETVEFKLPVPTT